MKLSVWLSDIRTKWFSLQPRIRNPLLYFLDFLRIWFNNLGKVLITRWLSVVHSLLSCEIISFKNITSHTQQARVRSRPSPPRHSPCSTSPRPPYIRPCLCSIRCFAMTMLNGPMWPPMGNWCWTWWISDTNSTRLSEMDRIQGLIKKKNHRYLTF